MLISGKIDIKERALSPEINNDISKCHNLELVKN